MTLADKQEIYYLCVREHGSIEVGAKLGASVFQVTCSRPRVTYNFSLLAHTPIPSIIDLVYNLQNMSYCLTFALEPSTSWQTSILAWSLDTELSPGEALMSTCIFSSTCANQVLQFIVGTALHLKLDGVALGKPPNTSSNTLMTFNDSRIFQYSVIELLDPNWLLSGPGFFFKLEG